MESISCKNLEIVHKDAALLTCRKIYAMITRTAKMGKEMALLQEKTDVVSLYTEEEYGQDSWRDAPPVLYEKRLVPVFDIAAGVACLFTAFTAMTMGHLYWYLFLLFYAVGAPLVYGGICHAAYPILRKDGESLVAVSCGFLSREHRLPHQALREIAAPPAVGTRRTARAHRFDVELRPLQGHPIPLGERHLSEEMVASFDSYLVPENQRVAVAEVRSVIRPLLLLEVLLSAAGLVGLIFSLRL